jgi:hypothetical protein
MDLDDTAVGAAGTRTAFETALDIFKSGLTPQQREEFAVCTFGDVQTAIRDIQDRLGSQRRMRNMANMGKFIEAMTQLGQVVEVFLNVTSTLAFIWVGTRGQAAVPWVLTRTLC